MNIPSRQIIAINLIGTVGYLMAIFVWVLFAAMFVTSFMEPMQQDILVTQPHSVVQQVQNSGFLIGLGYVVTGLMIVISIVILVALPYVIGRWGSWALRQLIEYIKIQPTKLHLFLVKCCVTAVPIVGFLFYATFLQPEDITFSTIYITALTVTILALVCFTLQLFLAKFLHVRDMDIW